MLQLSQRSSETWAEIEQGELVVVESTGVILGITSSLLQATCVLQDFATAALWFSASSRPAPTCARFLGSRYCRAMG